MHLRKRLIPSARDKLELGWKGLALLCLVVMQLMNPNPQSAKKACIYRRFMNMAEGVGFEPTVRLPVRLISSQVPLTTQPPFQKFGE